MNKKLVLLSACLLTAGTMTAQKLVTGHVTDASGQPVVGATIRVEGTKIFTRTDNSGNFKLTGIPASAKKLSVSYVGYQSANVSIAGNVSVVLQDNQLEEAVVRGYGTSRKLGTVVGTITKVGSDKIENKPVTTALDALQGKVAGVQILNSSGDVGNVGGTSTTIRGIGSLNGGNAPLYVIDGQPVDASVFYMMNPNDIASYSALRDASATSIYGSRAANGVIFVTTKRGRRGEKAMIKVGQSIGWSMLARRIGRPMNSTQLLDYNLLNGVITGEEYAEYKKSAVNTDWQDYYFKDNAAMYNTNFSVSGASDRSSYYVSASYLKKGGLVPGSHFKRYTARVNVDTKATDWFKMGVNIGLNYDDRARDGMHGALYFGNNATYSTPLMLPYINPYDKDGQKLDIIPVINNYSNDVYAHYMPSHATDARLTGTAFVELTPVKGLTIKSQLGTDMYDTRGTSMRYPSAPWMIARGNLKGGYRNESFDREADFTITNTVEYKWNINDNHNFTFLLGQEGLKNTDTYFSSYSKGQSDDRLMNLQDGTDVNTGDLESSKQQVQYLSFFGRLDYDLFGKYFFNLTLRNDASSRFGVDNRSATFASGGVMWNAKAEKFLKDVDWLDNLQLRFSSGSTGNSQGIGYYQSLGTVGSSLYDGNLAWYLASPGNRNLGWETQIQTTLGFNARLFNRLNIDFNYYWRTTKDMLMDVPVPYTTGFSTQALNIGSMLNKGVEVQFDVDAVKNWNGLNVNVYGNFSYNRDKITKLFYGMQRWDMPRYGLSYVVGESLNYFIPVWGGVDPANGKQYWLLPGEDGKVSNQKTYEFTDGQSMSSNTGKKRYAPINGGFGLVASWKGLTLSADFSYVLGKWMQDNLDYFTFNSTMTDQNKDRAILDYWQQPGQITDHPAFGEQLHFDTSLLHNASFMRLKNLSLTYDLPAQWMSATGFIRNIRLMATARNLFTVTKWKGADPEINTNISKATTVPNTREYTLGVEFTF